jgi:hypothetical protein
VFWYFWMRGYYIYPPPTSPPPCVHLCSTSLKNLCRICYLGWRSRLGRISSFEKTSGTWDGRSQDLRGCKVFQLRLSLFNNWNITFTQVEDYNLQIIHNWSNATSFSTIIIALTSKYIQFSWFKINKLYSAVAKTLFLSILLLLAQVTKPVN